MVDEIVVSPTEPAAAPAPVEVAAPLSPESAPAPQVEIPSTETAPAAEPALTETAPEAAKSETLLGGEKTPEEKPAEEKPAEEAPVETKEAEIETPVFEPFTLPEGATIDTEKMSEFTNSLAEFEKTTKASHEEVQKLGQQFLDRHIAEMQRYTETLTHAWNKQKNDWKDAFLKDPEFANRSETVVNSAIDAIGVYGGNAKQQEEFRNLMESSGVGNHPAMIRMLSNVMLAKAEPKPLAAPQIASSAGVSKVQKMYGKKSG